MPLSFSDRSLHQDHNCIAMIEIQLEQEQQARLVIKAKETLESDLDEFCGRYLLNKKKKAKLKRIILERLRDEGHKVSEY